MSGRRGFWWRVGRVFQPSSTPARIEREVDAEIRHHLDRTVEELEREGMSRERARRVAEERFGDLGAHGERLAAIDRRRHRMERRSETMAVWWSQLRQAARGIRAEPGFALTVILTLALGIGANATIFGVVDRVLLQPPAHVAEPDELRRVFVHRGIGEGRRFTTPAITYPDFVDLRAIDAFAGIAALSFPQEATLGDGTEARRIRELFVGGRFFELLGVEAALGRFLGPADDRTGAPEVVVLGHALWRDGFGADPEVVGRVVRIDDTQLTVVGVAPEGFTGIGLERIDAWLPLHSTLSGDVPTWESSRGWYWLATVARLADGVTAAAAEEEATAVHRQAREGDRRYDPEAEVRLAPLIAARGPDASDESRVAGWLSVVSGLVLLVACANVANLLLARGLRRRRETAVRLALGISRGRLVGQLLTESALLALAGGATAVAVAFWSGGLLRAFLFPSVHWTGAAVDLRVLLFTLAVSMASGLLAGVVPALSTLRQDVRAMFEGGEGAVSTGSSSRLGLMLLQGALSVVLLVGSGLFVRSLHAVTSQDLGLEVDDVHMVSPALLPLDLPAERIEEFFTLADARLEALPAVESVAFTAGSVPFSLSFVETIEVPGLDQIPRVGRGGPYYYSVSNDFFSTLGMRILRGRGFTADDIEIAAPVTVINETMAAALWPGQEALGKCLMIGREDPPCVEVVGIVETARRAGYVEEPTMLYYLPYWQKITRGTPRVLLVEAAGDAASGLVTAIRRELMALEPRLDWIEVETLRERIDPQARSWRIGATMFTGFGLLALVVASIGLYGLLSFELVQRRRELGVRAALGAAPARLVRLVFARGTRVTLLAVALGVAISLVAAPWIEPLLYGISPRDPRVYAVVVVVLLGVSVLATALPAWRTTRVDPMRVLRTD